MPGQGRFDFCLFISGKHMDFMSFGFTMAFCALFSKTLGSVDDTVPKLSGTIGVSRYGPAVPMVCDHVGSSYG